MPKEMLMEKAQELRAIADSLESYANELGGEEEAEGESESPMPPSKKSQSGGGKMAMAMSAMRNKMNKY